MVISHVKNEHNLLRNNWAFFQTSTKETNKNIVEAMIRQNDPTRELSNVHVLCIYVNLAKLLPDLP